MLARFADARGFNAVLIIAVGIAFPLALLFSGAAAALVTLRKGSTAGLLAVIVAWSLVAGLLSLAGQPPDAALLGILGVLAAVVLMATVLDRYARLNVAIWAGIVLAVGALSIFWLLVADPVAFWRDGFVNMLDGLAAQMGDSGGATLDEARLRQLVDALQWRGASGNVFGTLLLVACGGLFLGRSWQARLVNPGGFRGEFHRLQLHRPLAVATAVCFMLTALWPWNWLLNVAAILLYVWIIQGFAVIHGVIGILAVGGGWLVLIYLLCVIGWMSANPLVLLVPLLGLINEFVDVRGYVARFASK